VELHGREYSIDEPRTRALATIGAFRVVSADDLTRDRGEGRILEDDLRALVRQGLITQRTVIDRSGSRQVVALTSAARGLLEAHRVPDASGREQRFYSGVVKPRELAHDSLLYRAFQEEADRIEADGGRVARVILDYELKSAYQTFLNREDKSSETDIEADRRTFAAANDLHVVRGHLELPDLRIEYLDESGRLQHRDVELVTEHYSRGQLAGKARAGFTCYRAGGRTGSSRRGGTPFDPRHLERLS
jgi:hypothetical protein